MNVALQAAAILYIGVGTKILNQAQQAGYPFWQTAGGIAMWIVAAACAIWGFTSAIRERRKWREFEERRRRAKSVRIPRRILRQTYFRPR